LWLYTSNFNAEKHGILPAYCIEDLNDSLTFTTSNKETILKLYKMILLRMLLYECENWTLLKQYERSTETAEMNLLVSVIGYTLFDHKKMKELEKI